MNSNKNCKYLKCGNIYRLLNVRDIKMENSLNLIEHNINF